MENIPSAGLGVVWFPAGGTGVVFLAVVCLTVVVVVGLAVDVVVGFSVVVV